MRTRPLGDSTVDARAEGLRVTMTASVTGLSVLRALTSDARSDSSLVEVPGASAPLVMRVVKPDVAVDPAAFLARTQTLATVSHPSLRTVRGAGQRDDGAVYVLTDVVEADLLSDNAGLPLEQVVALGIEVAAGLEALHAAGLTVGPFSAADILLTKPALLDTTLAGLSMSGSERHADVRALAEMLIAAGAASADRGPFESTIRKTIQSAATATALREALVVLQERWLYRTAVSGTHSTHQPEVPQEPNRSGQALGVYQLERILGEGAMGTVYLAKHSRIGRLAAVKVLKAEHARSSELVQRFIHEAQAVNAIRNEHIVEVYDFGEVPQPDGVTCVYCVMELLDGRPLDIAMGESAFPLRRAVRVARHMALALHAAHQVGVVHRDIKPENIFLQKRDGDADFVKVLDFGVAKLLKPIGDLPNSGTQAGVVIGTPEYMAPEQALGNPTDLRVDLYAVGLVLYELLSGQQPFHGDTFGKLVVEMTTKPPPPLPPATRSGDTIPLALAQLVMKCLAKNPDERFQSGEELAAALLPYERGDVPVALEPADELVVRAPLWPKLAVVGLLVAAVAGGAVMVSGSEPPPPAPVVVAPPVVEVAPPSPVTVPASVRLEVTSTPPGASVTRVDTNTVLGVTPLTVDVAPVALATLRLELPGYEATQREVVLASNASLSIDLSENVKAERPKSPEAKGPKPDAAPAPKKPLEKKKVTHDGLVNPFEE
ncbi:MAG: protein kinase [Archangium sp.]|nr:protein kinase [Archangium sp.]